MKPTLEQIEKILMSVPYHEEDTDIGLVMLRHPRDLAQAILDMWPDDAARIKELEARCAELDEFNLGLGQESHRLHETIATLTALPDQKELMEALKRIAGYGASKVTGDFTQAQIAKDALAKFGG